MIFEYTSSVTIDEYDMNKICNDVKSGRDFGDALDDALSSYDDCDYYHIGDIYESVEKEIERRIKESEREETKMDFKGMTNDELITIQNVIQMELKEREEVDKRIAISNFQKAFEELEKYVWCIKVENYDDIIEIDNFDQFIFED